MMLVLRHEAGFGLAVVMVAETKAEQVVQDVKAARPLRVVLIIRWGSGCRWRCGVRHQAPNAALHGATRCAILTLLLCRCRRSSPRLLLRQVPSAARLEQRHIVAALKELTFWGVSVRFKRNGLAAGMHWDLGCRCATLCAGAEVDGETFSVSFKVQTSSPPPFGWLASLLAGCSGGL